MSVEVVMPQMGESITEGTVSKWLKGVGEKIGKDEPILEISTDKVDAEVPSPGEGVILEIRHQEGETVEVGTVLAVIGAEGEQPAASAPTSAPAPAAAPQPEPIPTPPAPQPEPIAAPPVQAAPAPASQPASGGSAVDIVMPQMGEIRRRQDRKGRASARDLHRQGRRRSSVTRGRHIARDHRRRRRDRRSRGRARTCRS